VRQLGGAKRPSRTAKPDPTPKKPTPIYPTADDAITAARLMIRGATLANAWTYPGDTFRVARFDLADGSKQFRPVHLNCVGWKIGDPPGQLPVYRADDLPRDETIFIVEGEKCADAARSIGLPAVTSSHGASQASRTDWTPMAGRDVVLMPDADDAGERYAADVSAIAAKLHPPARVKIIRLPGLPAGGDIADYIAERDGMESEAIARSIIDLAVATPWIDRADIIGGAVLVNLADVEPEEIHWLWRGRIALGKLTALVGEPGCGKSFIALDAAARITTGTPWPDGTICPMGSVVMACAEDDPADTIRPRFDAASGDASCVTLIDCIRSRDDEGNITERAFTIGDISAIVFAIDAQPDCRLLIIDPIGSYLGSGTDAHRDNEVRGMLMPLVKLARDRQIAVLIVMHTRKSSGGTADERALGSRAFVGVVRAVHHVMRDAENPKRRMMLPGKNNLAEEGQGLAFTIGGTPPTVQWERDPVTMSADDAYGALDSAGREDRGRPPAERSEAADWIEEQLVAGPVETNELKTRADADGLAWRTVRRAMDAMGVISERCPFTHRHQKRFSRPGNVSSIVDTLPNSKHSGHVDNLSISPEKQGISGGEDGYLSTCPELNVLGENGQSIPPPPARRVVEL